MSTPDVNKGLHVLRAEWENCTACSLGVRRQETGGSFVFGEGVLGAIMLIGEGPGKNEEKEGRPFVGGSGALLREAVRGLGIQNDVYYTNCVTCRSCAQSYDGEGQPKFWDNGQPAIQDQPPLPLERAACLPRLYEEIYMVDPIVIVALGATASETVLKRPVKITSESGVADPDLSVARIPGAGSVAKLTEKKKVWRRKVRGELVSPVEQNLVEYLCIPCLHPAYVLRESADQRHGSAMQIFVESLALARDVYRTYLSEVMGHERPQSNPKPTAEELAKNHHG